VRESCSWTIFENKLLASSYWLLAKTGGPQEWWDRAGTTQAKPFGILIGLPGAQGSAWDEGGMIQAKSFGILIGA